MSAAPIGSLVSLYYDSPRSIAEGDYIRTKSGRTYLIDSLRRQRQGTHVGRWHIKAIVVAPEDVAADATVHPLHWYARPRSKGTPPSGSERERHPAP